MKTLPFLLLLFVSMALSAQQAPTAMDYANFGLRKEFLDVSKKEKNVWILKEHDCPEQVPEALAALFASVNKSSQSHLLAMMKGDMRLVVFGLIIPESQHYKASGMNLQNYVAIATCLGGFQPSLENLGTKNPYFNQLTAYLSFIKQLEAEPYMHMGRELRFKILRQASDLKTVVDNPQFIGSGINIVGGHIFGDYSYIHENKVESREYKKIVLDNIAKLKGSAPLVKKQYLDFPILFFTPMAEFRNGFGGDISTGKSQADSSRLYTQTLPIRAELTKLGKTAIKLMLNKKKGRRIAINTNNLSKEGRSWLINYYQEKRLSGDTIPYLMLSSAVHGISWDNDSLSNPEFTNSSYFSLVENAIAREDLEAALASKGYIGIALYKDVLTNGTRFERLMNTRYQGSADYKNAAIEVLLANVFRCVEVMQTKEAWNHIGFTSGFDGVNSYFEGYDTAAEIKELRADMKAYLSNPKDIQDVYTAAEIKALMYDFTPQEITDKLFSLNAQAVTERLLQGIYSEAEMPEQEVPSADTIQEED